MTKLHHVKRARKAYPKHGIRRGMSYWFWKFFKQPIRRSLTKPRPSQLTRSEFLRSVYAAQEAVGDALASMPDPKVDADDEEEAAVILAGTEVERQPIIDALDAAADAVRELSRECEERAGNVEQRFPNGCPSLELLRERIEQCERLLEELGAARNEVEAAEDVESAVATIGWEVS